MRAIELRLDLVRAVNLGVTSWIDAAGWSARGTPTRSRHAHGDSGGARALAHLLRTVGDAPAYAVLAITTLVFARRNRRLG